MTRQRRGCVPDREVNRSRFVGVGSRSPVRSFSRVGIFHRRSAANSSSYPLKMQSDLDPDLIEVDSAQEGAESSWNRRRVVDPLLVDGVCDDVVGV